MISVDALEIFCERRKGVRHGMPDILFAIAILVDGVLEVIFRHELHEAHGPGPGAFHVLRSDHALLNHPQGVDKLAFEQVFAPARIGFGGQHLERIIAQIVRIGSERCLPAQTARRI